MNTKPYLSTAPRLIDEIEIIHSTPGSMWDYAVRFEIGSYLHISKEDADAFLLVLATRLYNDNNLSMDTAERLQYLASAVLVDKEARCPSCGGSGQVGSPWEPESCNTCRGTGKAPFEPDLTKDEYDALVADTMTEEQ